jgi:hypothetical protein
MRHVFRPNEGDKDVDIEQVNAQSSSSSSFTLSDVILGEPGGTTKTYVPFLFRLIGSSVERPRQTRLDAALPSPIERLLAYCRNSL